MYQDVLINEIFFI